MKYIEDLDTSIFIHTGGQTGSARVRGSGNDHQSYYQFKPTIFHNKYSRRWRAGDTDKENFGEMIASHLGRAMLSPEVVPEVSLVYDRTHRTVAVASKYLGEGMTLDDYAFNKAGIERMPGRSHVLVTLGKGSQINAGELSLEQHPELSKSEICDTIALAAMVDDNDVNPGNLVVITENDICRVARIDLGHAFKDLLNAPQSFGGRTRTPGQPVLDFFNRTHVAGARLGGDPSKLKRDYSGFVPSLEMVRSLRNISQIEEDKLSVGLANARIEFESLIKAMVENDDREGIKHVKNSLAGIYLNLKGVALTVSSVDEVMDRTFEAIYDSTITNLRNAAQVANIMEFQLEIEKAFHENEALSARADELLLNGDFPKNESGEILWISMNNEPGFKGSPEEYMKYRGRDINMSIQPITQSDVRADSRISTKFKSFKGVFQRTVRQTVDLEQEKEFFKTFEADGLRKSVLEYNDNLLVESDFFARGARLSGFSKAEKIKAVNALITALEGSDTEKLREYLPVLNDGRLGEVIKSHIQPFSVSGLVDAIVGNKIPNISRIASSNTDS